MSYHHPTISKRILVSLLNFGIIITLLLFKNYLVIKSKIVSTSAHNKYLKCSKNSSHSNKHNNVLSNLISKNLHKNQSSEQIFNTLLNGKLSFKTIYRKQSSTINDKSNKKVRKSTTKKDIKNVYNRQKKKLACYKEIEKLILSNSKPRKYLNWNNPINLFLKEVSHLD